MSIKAIILSYLNQCGGHFPHKRREVGDFVQRPYDIRTKIVGDTKEKILKVSDNQSYNLWFYLTLTSGTIPADSGPTLGRLTFGLSLPGRPLLGWPPTKVGWALKIPFWVEVVTSREPRDLRMLDEVEESWLFFHEEYLLLPARNPWPGMFLRLIVDYDIWVRSER